MKKIFSIFLLLLVWAIGFYAVMFIWGKLYYLPFWLKVILTFITPIVIASPFLLLYRAITKDM